MTRDDMIAKFAEAEAWVPGKRIRIDFGDEGSVLMDGQAQRVSGEDGPADTTIRVSWDDWQALARGELEPMSAFMSGRIKVEGDLTGALALQGVLGKLAG